MTVSMEAPRSRQAGF